ncbi:hypothetical protein ACVWWT_002808 [Pseudomonas sp. TE6349]
MPLSRMSNPQGAKVSRAHNQMRKKTKQSRLHPDDRKTTFLLPLTVCILSIVGSCIGIIITDHYSSNAYTQQKAFDWESKVIDKRFDTIDKLTRLIALQPGIQDEWTRYMKTGVSTPPRESSERLAAYNADYLSTLILAKLYFGQKTISAINRLTTVNSPWWMKSTDQQFEVLSAMTEELTFAIPTFTSVIQANANKNRRLPNIDH